MIQERLLRLAIALDNQAPQTIDKYICKLVENVLFDSDSQRLSAIELCETIQQQYDLEFDVDELSYAIKRRAGGSIQLTSGNYSLSPSKRESLTHSNDYTAKLRNYISTYKSESSAVFNEEVMLDLLQRYLYHCLNSNIDNLRSLLEKDFSSSLGSFPATNEDIISINNFIYWENADKNQFLYSIVSFSYEYCMMTTKKDALLSKSLFRGKCFLLDTNIIFRMAGINKDERKFVINSLMHKCAEVGIKLYYTNETLAEVYRVVSGQLGYIKHITQFQEPIDLEALEMLGSEQEANDFYELYDNWCRVPQNRHNDYVAFQQYLLGLIHDVLSNLNFLQIPEEFAQNSQDDVKEKCDSLKQHKDARKSRRPASPKSVATDVRNVLYTLSMRKTAEHTLWSTKEFFVSADQHLVTWAHGALNGIPVVVLPSVWLSIILRFTGRSVDDYKSFCLFLGLREHKAANETTIDPAMLLPLLAEKTISKSIKEKVILELIRNARQYAFSTNEEYKQSIEKGFDVVIANLQEENKVNLELEAKRHREAIEDERQQAQLKANLIQGETIELLARNKASAKIEFWENLSVLPHVLWLISALVWAALIVMFFSPRTIDQITPEILIKINTQWDFIKWIGVVIGFMSGGTGAFVSYLGSEKRKNVLYRRFYEKNRKDLAIKPHP